MTHRLIRRARVVLTMDDADTERTECDIRLRDGAIAEIGAGLAPDGAEIVDAARHVVTPGLVNTHHHLFQTLTRAVPGAQDAPLFDWLRVLYPIWARLTPQDVRLSATLGLAELALSGCSMSSDQLYLFPNGARLEDSVEGAAATGLRFHPTRGAMSVGRSAGGLPPDALVEDEASILADCERVVAALHDPSPGAMVRVGIAPCSPFSVSRGLMADAAALAREKGVRLHTHLAEDAADVAYSRERFGLTPGEYAESLGWTGPDVWHAHCTRLTAPEIALFGRTRTGVAHCPCSNGRLGSGIAPVPEMLAAGVPLGLGVDGSASSDRGDLLEEARAALLMARARAGAGALGARAALRLATRGGAELLGRDDLGVLAPGRRADLALWDVSGLAAAGVWDPAALVLAGPRRVDRLIVEGRDVVAEGRLLTVDPRDLAARARDATARLANG